MCLLKKAPFVTIGALCVLLGALPAGAAETKVDAETHDPNAQTQADGQSDGKASDDKSVSELPLTAGYEKNSSNGFFIRSKDGQFRLNIGAFTQVRYDLNWRDAPAGENDVEKGFSINRTRFFLEGQFTSKFDYHFRTNIDDQGDFSLLVAWLQYNIGDKWSLRGGKQFMAMSREDWMAATDVLTTEFSPNDFTFALGTAMGVQAHYQGERQRSWLALSDGAAGHKADFPPPEPSEIALTGRWEYQASGDDWSVWDDLVGRRGRPKGILVGLAGGYQVEQDSSAFDRVAQFNADVSFNGDGYQAMAAGSWTWHDPGAGRSFSHYGLLLQGGYFVTKDIQAYGQYNLVSPGDQPGNRETFNSVTAGVSYFPFAWTNRWKFSAEVGYLFDALNDTIVDPSGSLGWLPSDEAGQTYFRIQAQFGF
jgi:hypothetical protein